MALLEINLKRPALVEQRVRSSAADREPEVTEIDVERPETSESRRGPFVALVVVLAGAAYAARKLRSRGSDTESAEEYDVEIETESETETETQSSGRNWRRVGLAAAGIAGLLGVATVLRKVRQDSS